jgi:hypothetical protein
MPEHRPPLELITITPQELAAIDRLVAAILAGPGADLGEQIFDAFAASEAVAVGPPRELIADFAGVEPDQPAQDEDGPAGA